MHTQTKGTMIESLSQQVWQIDIKGLPMMWKFLCLVNYNWLKVVKSMCCADDIWQVVWNSLHCDHYLYCSISYCYNLVVLLCTDKCLSKIFDYSFQILFIFFCFYAFSLDIAVKRSKSCISNLLYCTTYKVRSEHVT